MTKQAWLQDPPYISVHGDGKNRIPTIHFKDIAMHVKFILYKLTSNFKERYIFTIDHTKVRTQKKIMKAISEGIGIKSIRHEEVTQESWNMPNFDLLMLDAWMKPSNMFKAMADAAEGEPDQADDEEQQDGDNDQNDPDVPKLKKKSLKLNFDWWCKPGIAKSMPLLCREFNEARGLKPNRIMLSGPPVSGISYFAKKLATFYNIPLIRVVDVIEAVKALGEENELAKEVMENLNDQKNIMKEKAQAELDKKKSQGFTGLPDEPDENLVESINRARPSTNR